MKPVSLYGKDILTLADFNVDEYNLILDTAREIKNIINRDAFIAMTSISMAPHATST